MVGGKVIETIDCGDKVWINCRDQHKTERGIYVERTDAARSVSEKDDIWWLNNSAYWTPEGKHFSDYKLIKLGMAGPKRPAEVLVKVEYVIHQ
jgi:hypothetical protein